jgi:hypothetical protein
MTGRVEFCGRIRSHVAAEILAEKAEENHDDENGDEHLQGKSLEKHV